MNVINLSKFSFLGSISIALLLAQTAQAGIRVDGEGLDWGAGGTVYLEDAAGDSYRSGADFASAEIGVDGLSLFIKLTFHEPYPTGQPDISVYFDVDGDASTGFMYNGTGVDATWGMEAASGHWTLGGDWGLKRGNFLTRSAYDSSAGILEMAFPVSVLEGLHTQAGVFISLVANDSLDRVADFGSEAIHINSDRATAVFEAAVDLRKRHSRDLRILSWNVLRDGPLGAGMESKFGRIVQALRPDIVCFQELYQATTPWTIQFMNRWVPLSEEEGYWTARKQNDCITVSRFPIEEVETVDANLITLVDTRELIGSKSWILNAHTPCCENRSGRLSETDNFMRKLRERKAEAVAAGEEPFAIFLVGDMNTGGSEREVLTMTEGLIYNELTDGPSFWPDWDKTSLEDLAPRQTHRPRIDTWRSLNNQSNTSRLDYIIYSDSLVVPVRAFVLNTRLVPVTFLSEEGLLATDTDGADHLPLWGDFRSVRSSEPFAGGVLQESGWVTGTQLGDVYLLEYPYAYVPGFGWLYQLETSTAGWFYKFGEGWIWLRRENGGWYYSYANEQWSRV